MAYARFSSTCPWYAYRAKSDARTRTEEQLTILHGDHSMSGESTRFTYDEVVTMLGQSEFSRLPGYSSDQEGFVRSVLQEFRKDVDEEYASS